MSEVKITCTVCPVGCRMTVKTDENGKPDGGISAVSGNTCPRGAKYAVAELTAPVRTLTSSVKIEGGSRRIAGLMVCPVRTDKPIPKSELANAMKLIHTLTATSPVDAGTVIARDFITPGTNLIATRDV